MQEGSQSIRRINVHNSTVYNLAVSNCGRYLASCSQDGTVHVFNKDFTVISTFSHPQTVRSIAFSDNPTRLFVACYDRNIYVYIEEEGETEQFRSYNMLQNVHSKEIKSISTYKNLLASCSRDRTVQVYKQNELDVYDFDCISSLQTHQQDIKSVTFDQKTGALLSCSYDNTVRLYVPRWVGIEDGDEPELEYLEVAVSSTSVSPDESKNISLLLFFSPEKRQELQKELSESQKLPEINSTIWSGEILNSTKDSTSIAVGDAGGNVSILKRQADKLEVAKQVHWHLGDCYSVKQVHLSSAGAPSLLTAGADGRVLCMDTELQPKFELRGLHNGEVNCAIVFQGKVVTAGDDGVICVVDGVFE